MVTVTIDDQKVEIEEEKAIIHAAKKGLGIRIPTLCHNELIEPYAACRICSVEIVRGKRRRIVTACNYPVSDGLVVYTNNERVQNIRKMILELLLARCSAEVPILKELAAEYGIEKSRFGYGKEECILCGLCVRVCDEIVGVQAISFANRGADRE